MARAIKSLPTPPLPASSTVARVGATRSIEAKNFLHRRAAADDVVES